MISGIFTSLALIAFLGITGWACARRNAARFDEASRLPLDEESVSRSGVASTAQPCGCQERP